MYCIFVCLLLLNRIFDFISFKARESSDLWEGIKFFCPCSFRICRVYILSSCYHRYRYWTIWVFCSFYGLLPCKVVNNVIGHPEPKGNSSWVHICLKLWPMPLWQEAVGNMRSICQEGCWHPLILYRLWEASYNFRRVAVESLLNE